jgi:protein-serine/threonine kinase
MNAQAARDPRNQAAQQQQQQQQARPNDDPRNRLHLNFGLGETNFAADVGRAFPTTPSTFPQPMYANQYGQRETWGTQQANYFMTNPYQPQFSQQQQSQQQQQQQGGAGANPGTQNGFNNAAAITPGYDVTNGLVHQLSQQHLGGSTPRSESPYGRQPSPAGRLRPDARPSQQQYGGSSLGVPTIRDQGPDIPDELPVKNPTKYSDNVFRRATVSKELVGAFFRENVQRARDRNQRCGWICRPMSFTNGLIELRNSKTTWQILRCRMQGKTRRGRTWLVLKHSI